jgi:hypothetical protein
MKFRDSKAKSLLTLRVSGTAFRAGVTIETDAVKIGFSVDAELSAASWAYRRNCLAFIDVFADIVVRHRVSVITSAGKTALCIVTVASVCSRIAIIVSGTLIGV